MSKGKASNPATQDRLKGLERRKQVRQDGDLAGVLSTEQGRRVFFRLMDGICGLNSLSFSGDRGTTDFKEGRRSVGVQLKQEIFRVCPEQWKTMEAEQYELQTEDRLFREKAEAATE